MPDRRERAEHRHVHRGRRAHDAHAPRAARRSQEHRDVHIDSGMEAGMQDALDLLEQVAVSLG